MRVPGLAASFRRSSSSSCRLNRSRFRGKPAPAFHSPERALLRNLFADQKAIWTSPLRIRLDDVQWLVPLLGGTAVGIASDTDIQNHIPTSPSFRKNSNTFSNYGVAAFAGVTGATWLWGIATPQRPNARDRRSERGSGARQLCAHLRHQEHYATRSALSGQWARQFLVEG